MYAFATSALFLNLIFDHNLSKFMLYIVLYCAVFDLKRTKKKHNVLRVLFKARCTYLRFIYLIFLFYVAKMVCDWWNECGTLNWFVVEFSISQPKQNKTQKKKLKNRKQNDSKTSRNRANTNTHTRTICSWIWFFRLTIVSSISIFIHDYYRNFLIFFFFILILIFAMHF